MHRFSAEKRKKGNPFYIEKKNIIFPIARKLYATLKAHDEHQAIADGDDDQERDDAAGDAAREEMLHLQVPQARLRVFHHDGRCICTTRNMSEKPLDDGKKALGRR